MHVIPPAPRACILLRTGQPPLEFPSRAAVFAHLYPAILRGEFGEEFTQPIYRTNWFGTIVTRRAITHVVLDVQTWRPLKASDFSQWLPARRPWDAYRYAFWNGSGPVSYTGSRYRHGGGGDRRPKTQRSRRMAATLDDHAIDARPGAGRNLPSGWDDVRRGDCGQRNWKRQRRTQWRKASRQG